jgi:hypothetical protein
MVAGAVLGLLAGLVSGGKLRPLIDLRLRWPLVVIAALLVRELGLRGLLGPSVLAPLLFTASLGALVLWTLWHRATLRGAWLLALGITMNLAVVLANGGRMPVAVGAARSASSPLARHGVWGQYTAADPDTRLAWLGDWITMPSPLGRLLPEVYSPGDLVAAAGLAVVLFLATRPAQARAGQG